MNEQKLLAEASGIGRVKRKNAVLAETTTERKKRRKTFAEKGQGTKKPPNPQKGEAKIRKSLRRNIAKGRA